MGFLNKSPLNWADERLQHLLTVFVAAYPSVNKAQQVAKDAHIEQGYFPEKAFEDAKSGWTRLMEVMNSEGKLQELCETAKIDRGIAGYWPDLEEVLQQNRDEPPEIRKKCLEENPYIVWANQSRQGFEALHVLMQGSEQLRKNVEMYRETIFVPTCHQIKTLHLLKQLHDLFHHLPEVIKPIDDIGKSLESDPTLLEDIESLLNDTAEHKYQHTVNCVQTLSDNLGHAGFNCWWLSDIKSAHQNLCVARNSSEIAKACEGFIRLSSEVSKRLNEYLVAQPNPLKSFSGRRDNLEETLKTVAAYISKKSADSNPKAKQEYEDGKEAVGFFGKELSDLIKYHDGLQTLEDKLLYYHLDRNWNIETLDSDWDFLRNRVGDVSGTQDWARQLIITFRDLETVRNNEELAKKKLEDLFVRVRACLQGVDDRLLQLCTAMDSGIGEPLDREIAR